MLLRGADEAAAAAGNRPLELQARHALGLFELDLGNLDAACTALDQATELAERSGLAWSGYGIDSRVLRSIAHYAAGSWDEAERVANAADERRPAVSAAALYVEVGRGRVAAVERLARLAPYRAADPYVAYLAGGCEADLVRWQGDPERSSELARATLSTQEEAGAPWVLSAIWPAALALAAQADLAEQARAAGDLAAQKEHLAVAEDLLERARAALQRARDRGRQVGPEALAWLARAEAEFDPGRGPARPGAAGRPRPTPSPTATCTRRPGAAGGWPRPSCWTAAATRPPSRPGWPTRSPSGWGRRRSWRRWRPSAGGAASTSASSLPPARGARPHPPRAGGAPPGGRRPLQRPDRRGPVHQPQDGQRPRQQHPGQAGRAHPHGSGRRGPPAGPRPARH